MSKKDDIKASLQAYADATSDLYLQSSIGQPGRRLEIENETVETGQAYAVPGFVDGMLTAIGGNLDALVYEQQVDAFAGQTTIQLDYEPVSVASLLVFRNGILLRRASGSSATKFTLSGKIVTLGSAASFGEYLYAWYLRKIS